MRDKRRIAKLILIVVLAGFAACRNAPTTSNGRANADVSPSNANLNSNSNDTNQTKEATHEHHAPHGGTLVEFGEEFAHLEVVLDSKNGWLTVYALDGEAEKSVSLAQTEIEIEIEKPQKFTVKLEAGENPLTGETKGATSEFSGQNQRLRNLKEFDASVKSITIRGREFKNVRFNFPKGNEDKHEH